MTKYKYMLLLLLGCFLLLPCNAKEKKNNTQQEWQMKANEYFATNNISSVLKLYLDCPNSRNTLLGILAYDTDYSQFDYNILQQFSLLSEADSLLHAVMDGIVISREEEIITNLSQCNLESIGQYYVSHPDQHSFLKPWLQCCLMDSLTTFGYDDLKHLHKAFAGTDFSECVDMQYSQQRTLVMPEVKRSLTDYIKMENNTIKYYRNMALNSCNNYVSAILPKIVDELFDKDLPENDADLQRRFYTCCEKHLSNTELLSNIISQAELCIDELNAGKKEYQETLLWTDDMKDCSFVRPSFSVNCKVACPLGSLREISKIQNKTDWLGIGLAAASFFTGGITGLLVGAADMVHSYNTAKEDANIVSPYMISVANTLARTMKKSVNEAVNHNFNKLAKAARQSQQQLEKHVNETF